ncbi:MAG TPA: UvrD-helicase domain-containing protein [Thermoleophilaceae bacterium]|nr:UvrD-helicase domain-containing protein [Thermoleophilaceae bacterium]
MTPRFTPEQQRAVDHRRGSLFLHANAGSGKTSVLVERFVRAVLEDGVPVDRILAITFTDKAAAELSQRIRDRFIELDRREEARGAEGAWVSTIHGFCSRLLRAHPLGAGIDPEYRVLSEPETERIGIDAFERALEEFLASGIPEDAAWRLELLASYTPGKLERMVRTVHSRLRSRGEREPVLPSIDRPVPTGTTEAAELEAAARGALAAFDGVDGKRVRDELRKARQCLDAVVALGGRLGDHVEFGRWIPKPGGVNALAVPAFERWAEAHRAYLDCCRAARELRDYALLRELLALYGRHFSALKEARSGLDFEDLELLARDLLAGDAGLRERYRERFEHVMVDEFQDTNGLQVSILRLIERDNLFTVGDANQSIYAFRNADVSVFRGSQADAARAGRDARIGHNFRSRPELLDNLNLAFESVFGGDFEPLLAPPDAGAEPAAVSPSIELLVVAREGWDDAFPKDGDQPFGQLPRVPIWRAAEARLLADRVAELAGPDGPFDPGDVAVLVRASTDIGAYERALADCGIPTYVAGGRGYFGQQQVGDLRAYLAALANPLDELALYSLLASPLVGASLDALGIVGLRADALGRDVWWALREAFAPGGDGSEGLAGALPAGDRTRVAEFVRRFAAEREAAPRLSLETLIDEAVTGSGYDRAVLRMPDGERRMANVRKLMRLAREYEADEGRDLRGFIDFVAEQDLLRAREGEAPLETEGIDAVRLMTIHAAKGLEFPVVCVADLGRAARGDDDALRVTDDGRVGLSIASIGGGATSGMALDQIKEEQTRLADEEERRIFYVAMTRAREHLIVSGATDTTKWPEPKSLCAPVDWVWRALVPDLPELGGEAESVRLTSDGREARVRTVVCSPAELERSLPREAWAPEPPAPADEASGAGVQPPLEAAVEAAGAPPLGRLSYSSLESYRRCGYRFYLERVARLRERTAELADEAGEPVPEGLGALLRGTVVHELLERFDFVRPRPPDAEDVSALLAVHGVEPTESDVADIRSLIEGFARSALCARLSTAARVRRELAFAFTLRPQGASGASLLVNGVVDVHALEGGSESALVVDYKSDPVGGVDLERTCEEKYGTQRLIYALAALRSGAPSVEVVHCFLERADEPVSAVFAAADLARLEQELLRLADGVVGGRFEPSDRPHRELCATCPGQAALCSWDRDRTLAPLSPPV